MRKRDIGFEASKVIGCLFSPAALSKSVRLAVSMSFSLRGIHATARVHHAFRRRSNDVATRGPRAATSEDEADRYRFPLGQSQRNKHELSTALPRFFEELSRLGYVEG